MVFVLGPAGVGKTGVARRLLAPLEPLEVDFRGALVEAVRRGGWAPRIVGAPAILLDGLDCLEGRLGAIGMLVRLLEERAVAGRRSVLCQGVDDSLREVASRLPCPHRATVLLRFPVGRGRRRHVQVRAAQLGVAWEHARELANLEPWTYARVDAGLLGIRTALALDTRSA